MRILLLFATFCLIIQTYVNAAFVPSPGYLPARLRAREVSATVGWRETVLLFGLSVPGGGNVSQSEFDQFLADVVTPRFPDGLTVLDAKGQWYSTNSNSIVHEESRYLIIFREDEPNSYAKIQEIFTNYSVSFQQESVLVSDEPAAVCFSDDCVATFAKSAGIDALTANIAQMNAVIAELKDQVNTLKSQLNSSNKQFPVSTVIIFFSVILIIMLI